MTTRDALYRLIDELSEDELAEAELCLRALRDRDAVLRMPLEAPWDDEPETDAERAAVAEAYEDVRKGRLVPMDAIEREFGA